MVVLRMLLQELCLNKSQWDDTIPQDKNHRLQKWMTDLQRVDNVRVNRYYFPGQKTKVKSAVLHGFGDASRGAYCAVVYLCIESEDEYRTSLVAAKTRVAPSTPMTIPRLELLAALILARLVSAVREALTQMIHIEEVFCWTDSITVFHWIQSDKEFKQFVQNRIDEIHKLTDVKSWRHCPGIENPADIGSRGCLASELVGIIIIYFISRFVVVVCGGKGPTGYRAPRRTTRSLEQSAMKNSRENVPENLRKLNLRRLERVFFLDVVFAKR